MEDATREHNVKARKDAIGEGLAKLYNLDQEIKQIIDCEVKPLREDKAAIKASLRENYQITTELLNARYASYKLEQFALKAGDEATIDVIRELFKALPIGGMVDLVEAAERAAAR